MKATEIMLNRSAKLVLILSLLQSCIPNQLIDTEARKLHTIIYPKFKINIIYIPSNATNQASIQVQKQVGEKENVIANYNRYNCLDKFIPVKENALVLILRDTVSILGNKPDTVTVLIDR